MLRSVCCVCMNMDYAGKSQSYAMYENIILEKRT